MGNYTIAVKGEQIFLHLLKILTLQQNFNSDPSLTLKTTSRELTMCNHVAHANGHKTSYS